MTWIERQLLKCADGPKDPALDRAVAIFRDWLTVPKHVVRPGEVLSGIARSSGVGLRDIMEFNGISSPLGVRPGQVVRIPSKTGKGASNVR